MSARPVVHCRRIGPTLMPDRRRVLLRPFYPSSDDIARAISSRVLALSEEETAGLLAQVLGEFEDRHQGVEKRLRRRYAEVRDYLGASWDLSAERQALLGAYFTHEYSLESAALFNPSIVLHPDQSGLPAGALRFILSLRATGEGHISSITFRTGILRESQRVTVARPARSVTEPKRVPDATFEKALFARKLVEAGLQNEVCEGLLGRLGGTFVLEDLRRVVAAEFPASTATDAALDPAVQGMLLLAESNYSVDFSPDTDLSERVLFPSVSSERNGMEDARFVRFQDDDGAVTYYATYTAYDGRITLPQLLETSDFVHFEFSTLNGPAVQNKGMALFPRKIDGRYAILSRQDDESIHLMYSDNVRFWQTARPLMAPAQPWEYFKIGNCGSPIETDAGWLVLTHGVGPMRKYRIGAALLDLHDPSRVIARLRDPLLSPNEAEREGYVPNVVYTCGALLHGDDLVIPYGMSDDATSFATVSLEALLTAMEQV